MSLAKNVALVKSKERVKDMGEVFTPDFLVERMLTFSHPILGT